MKGIEVVVRGIQCDVPGCGYVEEGARLEDGEKWLGRPCPRCGANLLTEGDLAAARLVVAMVDWINAVEGEIPDGSPVEEYRVKFDGGGGVEIVEGRVSPK